MKRVVCLISAVCGVGFGVVPRAWAATFVVNSTADAVDVAPGDGVCATTVATCSLRAAIQEANALGGADTITLPAGTYTLGVTGAGEDAAATGDLDITGDLSITGAPTGQTIVSGAGIDRVFDILSPAVVSLSRLTVQSGNASAAGAAGGGIRNAGTLNLSQVTIQNNTATGDGGGLATLAGATARLTNVTLAGNSSPLGLGGGIAIIDKDGRLQLINVTLNGNSAHQGGDIDNLGKAQAVNTIFANSLPSSTCAGAAITSLGHNIDSSMTCFFPLGPGDLENKDPKLDTLLDTGSTFVFPLKMGSPAIDAGDNLSCPSIDQRGQLRPAAGNPNMISYVCDIGAYEVAGPVLPTPTASPTGTATSTSSPPTATNTPPPTGTPAGGSISLSHVIGQPGEQVVFAATLSTKGASIARTQNDVAFDSTNAPVAALPNGAPDCTVNPQIGKEATSFAFQPGGCSGAACNTVHASVLSAINSNAIADGTLYTCTVAIAAGAAASAYPLTISGVVLQAPDGQALPNAVGSSGAVVVVIPTPTSTPGSADCCQCGPAVCGPGTGGCVGCTVVFGGTCDGTTGQCVTATVTPTASRTATPPAASTPTPTRSPTPPPSGTPTTTTTSTPTGTPTVTAVVETATATNTVVSTATPTTPQSPTLTPTSSATATSTTTDTPEGTASATPTTTPTPGVSATTTETPTATPTTEEAATATASPTASHTVTPTEPGTATATASPSPTPSASPTQRPCPGDCDHSGSVTITDLVTLIDLALQSPPTSGCPAGDINGDGQITIDEILVAVHNGLSGCPSS
ncbi:MAG TPA: choice-of-anchor Q domain-containing protein [Candidatus Margulisiibacteriota bacterium]|nr:choice-of-anchor Q domain-containing protein [Candidatus Margulisiibacteriota bacterium]